MDQDVLAYLMAQKPRAHTRILGLKKGQLTLQTCKEPRLFYLLKRINVPIPYTTIEINDSVDYKPKKSKHAFWAISNGTQLKTDDGQTHDILHGKLFPPATAHSIIPDGRRPIILSFWDEGSGSSLTPFEAVTVAGEWKIAVDLPGLPRTYLPSHGTKKHKIVAATTPPLEPMRGDLNPAQMLLLTALNGNTLDPDANRSPLGSVWDSLSDHHRF